MSKLLPEIIDRKQYGELFSQDAIWEQSIQHLADKHQLAGVPRRGVRGSHIVYRIGNSWIKVMAPLFARDMAYEVAGLECIVGRLNVDAPKILAQGVIEGWPYIVLSHVEGERIGDVWGSFNSTEKNSLARQIAKTTLELQACAANSVVRERGVWKEFIKARLENIVPHHKSKNLDPRWLEMLPTFLSQFDESEFVGKEEVFLHADLTWDHFLVSRHNDKPVISGVIDLADCRVGHSEYDIPASAAFIFKNEPASLREYLLGMGYPDSQLNQRLSEKLMAWTCLHFFSDLKNYFSAEMARHSPGDFSALAGSVFPLEDVRR